MLIANCFNAWVMGLLKKNWALLLIVLVSVLPLLPLLHPGLPLTHDGQDHVARIAAFYQSLSEGNIIPRWAGNLNWGYGHPILMFLYPLPSYVASLFHFLGFTFVDSTKLVFAFSFIAGAIAMYLWLKEFLSREAAFCGALLYNFAPYRFIDLYVRGAIGEHTAFIFPPLILLFLLKISKAQKFSRFNFVGVALSFAGLILAHNAISIMFLPFILFYCVYLFLINEGKKSLLYQFIASLLLGLLLSAFFIFPAFIEGKYTLRDIVTSGVAQERFVEFKSLIYGPWNYGGTGEFSVQIGILQLLGISAFPAILYILYKRKDKMRGLYILTLVTFFLSIFIMLPASKIIWESVTTLQKFQFPWRFLSLSVFTSAVLFSFLIYVLPRKVHKVIIIFVVIMVLLLNYDYWQPTDYQNKPESFYAGIYNGTTDTGESSPIWSVRFMEHAASASAEVLKGSAVITPLTRSSTRHSYNVNAEYRSRIRENTLYFPGWRIYIDGKLYSGVQFQDPESRGLMTYYIPTGEHKVEVVFGDTRLRTISNYVSLAALIIVVGLLLNTFALPRHPRPDRGSS